MPVGIAEQIDELDQLLDKLLQLPIDRAVASTVTPQLRPVVEEEPETAEGILRFPPVVEEPPRHPTPPSLSLHEPQATPVKELPAHTEPLVQLPEEPPPLEPAPEVVLPRLPESAPPRVPLTDEALPWMEDEPLPVQLGQGPKVEIVQGPDVEVVRASDWVDPDPVNPAPHRPSSWFFWLLFACTWLFDHTLGRWFPFLRRPTVKFQLGLIGVALLALSIYIAWQGLMR